MAESLPINERSRICVAGGDTLVGAAILDQLRRHGYQQVIGGPGAEPDWTDRAAVEAFVAQAAPEFLFLAAGKSGGIGANQAQPAELMLDNLLVQCHAIAAAQRHGVRKLLYLASSCSYPKLCPQPMHESALLTGPWEPTNEAYAAAKMAGIKLCQAYRDQYGANFVAAIPANPFGPGDDFSPANSHVVAALMRRMHEAKLEARETVEIWGSGSPRREFIFAGDLADAALFAMQKYNQREPINLGGGADVSIAELAAAIREVTGFAGRIQFDPAKPDGMPVKVLDSTKLLALGWRPQTALRAALEATYEWFLESYH